MKATLLLGSNLGNRKGYIKFAKYFLKKDIGKIISESHFYETEAWGGVTKKPFINQALILIIDAALSPYDLLKDLQHIEQKAGRKRTEKWNARTLDIDIIFIDNAFIQSKELTVPHPEIANRRFALEPLAEICPDYIISTTNKTVKNTLKMCSDTSKIKRLP